jgi:hypothetical protein
MRRNVERALVVRPLFATLLLVASVAVSVSPADAQVEVFAEQQQAAACSGAGVVPTDIAEAMKNALGRHASGAAASTAGAVLEPSSPHRKVGQPGEGTKCEEGVFRVHARPGSSESGCPAQINLGSGHYIRVDGEGGACSATATCNAGGTVDCSWPDPAACEAHRLEGDGYVQCYLTAASC